MDRGSGSASRQVSKRPPATNQVLDSQVILSKNSPDRVVILDGPTSVLLSSEKLGHSSRLPIKNLDFPIKEIRSNLKEGERKNKRRMTDQFHRTSPIPDTKEHVRPYPDFFMYKIPGCNYYQATARLNGVRAKKSLKTESRQIAKQAAKEFFDEL